MTDQIKVGIIGAAGYTAGELIRLLNNHPNTILSFAQSDSQAGKPIYTAHTDLIGDNDLEFVQDFDLGACDVIFLCKGHGESKKFLEANHVPDSVKIVDLSHDYRLKNPGNDFVYGLPELNKSRIKSASQVANPGCFATCIQVGLLPAASNHLIQGEINTSGITGSTGAGQALSATSHFSWRNNNMSVYKAFTHQHLDEIGESLNQLDGKGHTVNFIPYRGDFTRGIIITSYFDTSESEENIIKMYQEFYSEQPFTFVVSENPDLKQVVNTNKALVYPKKFGNKLMVISVIDNLLKGASGQALQNMNLMFDLEETLGLRLKSAAF
ncbi:MAG: N-acetyl-gamma-glutamyl-phosphate reductase [Bacteroidota bacterium]